MTRSEILLPGIMTENIDLRDGAVHSVSFMKFQISKSEQYYLGGSLAK